MSKLSQLKGKVGYQERVPRCSTCKSMRQQQLFHNSMPTKFLQVCGLHAFTIKPHACCDDWQSKDGEVLEKPVSPKTILMNASGGRVQ